MPPIFRKSVSKRLLSSIFEIWTGSIHKGKAKSLHPLNKSGQTFALWQVEMPSFHHSASSGFGCAYLRIQTEGEILTCWHRFIISIQACAVIWTITSDTARITCNKIPHFKSSIPKNFNYKSQEGKVPFLTLDFVGLGEFLLSRFLLVATITIKVLSTIFKMPNNMKAGTINGSQWGTFSVRLIIPIVVIIVIIIITFLVTATIGYSENHKIGH